MKASGVVSVAWFFVLAAGCSGSHPGPPPPTGPLDCAWLASDNCMKATLMEGMSCVGPPMELGVLSADSTTCTYPSGVVVTFDAPLLLPIGLNPLDWHFSVARGGTECLRYDSTDNVHYKLVVNGKTLMETGVINVDLTVTCPDGTTYSNSTDAGLLSCDPGGLATAQAVSSGENEGSLSIQLFPTDIALTLFDCRR